MPTVYMSPSTFLRSAFESGLHSVANNDDKFITLISRLSLAINAPITTGLSRTIRKVFANSQHSSVYLDLWLQYYKDKGNILRRHPELQASSKKLLKIVAEAVKSRLRKIASTDNLNDKEISYLQSVSCFLYADQALFADILDSLNNNYLRLLILLKCLATSEGQADFLLTRLCSLDKEWLKSKLEEPKLLIEFCKLFERIAKQVSIDNNTDLVELYGIMQDKFTTIIERSPLDFVNLHLDIINGSTNAGLERFPSKFLELLKKNINDLQSEAGQYELAAFAVTLAKEIQLICNVWQKHGINDQDKSSLQEIIDVLFQKLSSINIESLVNASSVLSGIIEIKLPMQDFPKLLIIIERYVARDPEATYDRALYFVNLLRLFNSIGITDGLKELVLKKLCSADINEIFKYIDRNPKEGAAIADELLQLAIKDRAAFDVMVANLENLSSIKFLCAYIESSRKPADKEFTENLIKNLINRALEIVQASIGSDLFYENVIAYLSLPQVKEAVVPTKIWEFIFDATPREALKVLNRFSTDDQKNIKIMLKYVEYVQKKIIGSNKINEMTDDPLDVAVMRETVSKLYGCLKLFQDDKEKQGIIKDCISKIINRYEPLKVLYLIAIVTKSDEIPSDLLRNVNLDLENLSASTIEKVYFSEVFTEADRNAFVDYVRRSLEKKPYALAMFQANLDLAIYNKAQRDINHALYQKLTVRGKESVMEMVGLLKDLFPKIRKYVKDKKIEVPSIDDVRLRLKELAVKRILGSDLFNIAEEHKKQWEELQQYISEVGASNIQQSELTQKFPYYYDSDHLALIWLCQDDRMFDPSVGENPENKRDMVKFLRYAYACAVDAENRQDEDPDDLTTMSKLIDALAAAMRSNNVLGATALVDNNPACVQGTPGFFYEVFKSHPEFKEKDSQHHAIRERIVPQIIADKVQKEFRAILDDQGIAQASKVSAMQELCASLTVWSSDNPSGLITSENTNRFATAELIPDDEGFLRMRQDFMKKYFPNGYKDLMDAVIAQLQKPGQNVSLTEIDQLYLRMQFQVISDSSIQEVITRNFVAITNELSLPETLQKLQNSFRDFLFNQKTDQKTDQKIKVELQQSLRTYLSVKIYSDPNNPQSEATDRKVADLFEKIWPDVRYNCKDFAGVQQKIDAAIVGLNAQNTVPTETDETNPGAPQL